jgi:hypothetical protein
MLRKKINLRYFSEKVQHPLDFLEKKFEDMPRNYKLPPKKESLVLYRDVIKVCRKFFWNNQNGKEWSVILQKSARKEFEENRNLLDSAEVGRKLVIGRQAILEVEEKILKVHSDMNKFVEETKNK